MAHFRGEELYALGGRAFLVLNLAPVGCYPSFLVGLPPSELDAFGCSISYNNAVVDYNNMLKEALRQTRGSLPNASLIYVDTSSGSSMDQSMLWAWPVAYNNFEPKVFCGNTKVINGRTVTATASSDPSNYVSWDGVHATEAANKLVTWAILDGSYSDPPFPFHDFCDLQPLN
ncbi:GDSL esterase/lipase [Prunus yedoensis var. nudiflora]|uniref:GDSL esterase/lipase n=1 Tax=Prunus yedoensis var. nudiflora TaxID=2094558 RepID=A0A314XID9_PRUYE|nr:GDSL esterase/lipase [Prunus yedoensis var. nudiflora]